MQRPGTQIVRPAARASVGELVLERWRSSELEQLYAAISANLDHLRPWMPWVAQHSRDSVARFLADNETGWQRGERFEYAIRDREATLLGSAGLMGRIGPGGLEIGYWIDGRHTRRGIATLAAAALAEMGLALSTVDRVEIHHDEANLASGAIPARLGFTSLGAFPEAARAPADIGRDVRWRLDAARFDASTARALLKSARAGGDEQRSR
jgi:RimJ/RimL family protein N-acetyltransferase